MLVEQKLSREGDALVRDVGVRGKATCLSERALEMPRTEADEIRKGVQCDRLCEVVMNVVHD